MQLRGQVTVFISLVMMCIFALLCCLVESARTEGARWYLQMAASSAMDSLFSRYHRPLWDDYRLLFSEYPDDQAMAEDFRLYLDPYLETENWYPMAVIGTNTEALSRATDDQGIYLETEILDYMRYGIWQLDFDADSVSGLWDSITEADAVTDIAGDYRGHATEAMRLERALEAISKSLDEQMSWREKGLSALHRYDGPAFRSAAGQLIRELKRMPGLVAAYRKQADALAGELAASRQQFAARTGELSGQMQELLDQEIRQYESYIAEDGRHRQEIEQKETKALEQIPFVESLIEEAREVERIIDEWDEDDEDDDGPDLASLWSPVRRQFERFTVVPVSFAHGIADKEKEGFLKSIQDMCGSGLLHLVLPEDRELSTAALDLVDAPSQTVYSAAGARSGSLVDHILVNEYCGLFFPSFRSEAGNYEMEYLLAGQNTDRENLEQVVLRLLAVREGLNLIHILSDPIKRDEARNLALVIVGAAAITPIVFVMTFFIMCIWALGEAVMDIRSLLAGSGVVLIKTRDTWTLSLEQLLTMGSSKTVSDGGKEGGLRYLSWLKILLIVEDKSRQEYRMMDMIQKNLRQGQDNFRMKNCVYQAQIKTNIRGKHVFFSLGFVDRLTGGGDHTYPMEMVTERTY